jgi:hypothetical protein
MKKDKGFGETTYSIWIFCAVIIIVFHTLSVFAYNIEYFNPIVLVAALIFILLAYVFKTSKILNHQPVVRIKNESALAVIMFNITFITAGPILFRRYINFLEVDPNVDHRFILSIAFLSVLSTVFLIIKSLKYKAD